MVYREDGSRLPRSENALLRAWGAVEAGLVERIRAGVTRLACLRLLARCAQVSATRRQAGIG